jgi:hypothetical protein
LIDTLAFQDQLRDSPVWKNRYFWEAAFFEHVARERKQLPTELHVDNISIRWEDMSSVQQEDALLKEANLLFGVLGQFGMVSVHNASDCLGVALKMYLTFVAIDMLNVGLAADDVRHFLRFVRTMILVCDLATIMSST